MGETSNAIPASAKLEKDTSSKNSFVSAADGAKKSPGDQSPPKNPGVGVKIIFVMYAT